MEETDMYTCSEARMEDKIKTFSTFGDAGHGGITRYSLNNCIKKLEIVDK